MKTITLPAALSLSLSLLLGACASYGPAAPAKASNGLLTGTNGMTLYTFDKDPANGGKSMCNGPCANNWPPLLVGEGEQAGGDYSIVIRDDGKKQWAYKGKPLYFWVKDQKPGDSSGEGFNQVWHSARP